MSRTPSSRGVGNTPSRGMGSTPPSRATVAGSSSGSAHPDEHDDGSVPHRSSAVPEPLPAVRTMIYPRDRDFSDTKAVRKATKICRGFVEGPWCTWHQVPEDVRRRMFECFQNFPPPPPDWISPHVWSAMIDKWNNGHWKYVSMGARANRNTLVDGEVAKHTAGSITFAEHDARLTKAKKGVPPTAVELFDHTHKKRSMSDTSSSDTGNYVTSRCSRIVDEYNTSLTEKYGEDVSNYPLVDTELWQQAVGGSKKGRLFGFGFNEDPNLVLTGSYTQSTACSSSSQKINVLRTKIENLMEENRLRREEDERRQKQIDEMADLIRKLSQSQQFPPQTPP